MPTRYLHIAAVVDWENSQSLGRYAPDDYAVEGFIHLSTAEQVERTANLLFKDRDDLVLLIIDPDLLRADLVFEPGSHGEEEIYPHLYGPLDLAAVEAAVELRPQDDGTFALPPLPS